MVPNAQATAPPAAYPTPRPETCPANAPALTTTMPANPSSSPATFAGVIDSPSSRHAITPTSTGCR
jgi:hypothetical protein